jgi:hypothetical protein
MSAPGALHSAGAGECRRAMCCTHVGVGSEYQHRPGRWLSKEGRLCLESGRGWRMGRGNNGVHAASTDRRLASRTFPLPLPALWRDPVRRFGHVSDNRVSLCGLACSRCLSCLSSPPRTLVALAILSACFFLANPLHRSLARLHRFRFMLLLC